MKRRTFVGWAVALGLTVAAGAAVIVTLLASADDESRSNGEWSPFTMVYEETRITSTNGVLDPPSREVIKLEWRDESSWKRTVLVYGDDPDQQGDSLAIDGTTLTRYDASLNESEEEEVEGRPIPELWFIPISIAHHPNDEREKIPGLGFERRVWRYTFACDEEPVGLLCHVTGGRAGSGVEITTYDAHGIPVAFSDTVGSVTITSITMLSLEFD